MIYLLDRDEKIKALPDVWFVQHTEELNAESVIEFFSLKPVDKYEHVLYQDANSTWHEFVVSGVDERHEQNGDLHYIIYAESVLTELSGDWIEDRRIVNLPASTALERALSGTRWSVGTVDALGNGTVNFYRESAYSALSKIIKTYGCELQTRITVTDGRVTARHIDLLIEIGSDNGARFEWSRNILEIGREILRDDIITALHGYGRGAEIGDGFGRRIDFADINGGLSYVADEDARRLWGRVSTVRSWESVADAYDTWSDMAAESWASMYAALEFGREHRHGKVEFDELTDPAAIKIATQAALDSLSKPQVSYTAKVIDFASAGLTTVELGDTVVVIDDDLGVELKLRVLKLVRNPMEPLMDEITLGQVAGDYAKTAARTERTINGLRSVHGVTRMVSEDGKSWIDYSVPEIYLNGDDGNLRIDTDVIFQLHDELGQMVAGFTELGGQKGLFTKFLSNTADGSGGYGTVGGGASGGLGYQFHHGGHEFMLTFDVGYGVQLYVDNKRRQAWGSDGSTTIYGSGGNVRLALWSDGSIHLNALGGDLRLSVDGTYGGTEIQDETGNNRLGVDGAGPYMMKAGVKTYF